MGHLKYTKTHVLAQQSAYGVLDWYITGTHLFLLAESEEELYRHVHVFWLVKNITIAPGEEK
jgi:hypothetical protein